jgi:hypothetical protein
MIQDKPEKDLVLEFFSERHAKVKEVAEQVLAAQASIPL